MLNFIEFALLSTIYKSEKPLVIPTKPTDISGFFFDFLLFAIYWHLNANTQFVIGAFPFYVFWKTFFSFN